VRRRERNEKKGISIKKRTVSCLRSEEKSNSGWGTWLPGGGRNQRKNTSPQDSFSDSKKI